MSMSPHFEFNNNNCLPPFGWSEFAWKNLELVKPDNLSVAVYSPSLFATIAAMVCLLRTDKLDFVMDNLIDGPPIVWFARNFETISIMSPDDPNKWLIPLNTI